MRRQRKPNNASQQMPSTAPKPKTGGTASKAPANQTKTQNPDNDRTEFEKAYAQLLKESAMPPPGTEPEAPRPRTFKEYASRLPLDVQRNIEKCYQYFAKQEDKEVIDYIELTDEYKVMLRECLDARPETEQDVRDLAECWEILARARNNIVPPIDIRTHEDVSQPCSSSFNFFSNEVDMEIQKYRVFADVPSEAAIDPAEGRAAPQHIPVVYPFELSPLYSPSSPLDGEGEQCSSELRAPSNESDNGPSSDCSSPVNSYESDPEIMVVNEIKGRPRNNASHEIFDRRRRVKVDGVPTNLLEQVSKQEPIDVHFGYEGSSSEQQCSSSQIKPNKNGVQIDTKTIEFSFDPLWKAETNKVDKTCASSQKKPTSSGSMKSQSAALSSFEMSALAKALEGETDVSAIHAIYQKTYEKKFADLTLENQLVISENMKLKEKLIEMEKKLDERNGLTGATTEAVQKQQQPSNNNKKKNKKKGKK